MDSFTILAILFVAVAAIVLVAVTRSKSSGESFPPISSGPASEIAKPSPISAPPIPETTIPKPVVTEDTGGKWIHTKAKEKFIPQDTVYEYRRMAPCMLCPFCDAENDVGSTRCHVCGMSFRRGV